MKKAVGDLVLDDFVVFQGRNCHVRKLESAAGVCGMCSVVTLYHGCWEAVVTMERFHELELVGK